MAASKIAITLDQQVLSRIDRLVDEKKFPSRSRAIQVMLNENLNKLEKNRLRQECEKLDPAEEENFAEEGMSFEVREWPEY